MLWDTYRFCAKPGLFQTVLLKIDDPSGPFSAATLEIVQDKALKIFQRELAPLCHEVLLAFQKGDRKSVV